jgi:hypothetical protein
MPQATLASRVAGHFRVSRRAPWAALLVAGELVLLAGGCTSDGRGGWVQLSRPLAPTATAVREPVSADVTLVAVGAAAANTAPVAATWPGPWPWLTMTGAAHPPAWPPR